MSNIIGIGGLAGAGKSSLATLIQRQTGHDVVAFADQLKEIVALLTGCKKSDLNNQEFKNNILGPEWNHCTYRYLLQTIGTNLFRNRLNKNVWVSALFNKYSDNIIISDVRFPNELKAIKDRGGITIYVDRIVAQGAHQSENAVNRGDFDYVVDNNGNLNDLMNNYNKI